MIALNTGIHHLLVIRGPRASSIELAGVHFNTGRSVLLPLPALADEASAATPLRAVVRAVFRFAAAFPGKQLLIAGHADSAGGARHNLVLSERRARSLEHYLAGDRAAWAGQAHEFGEADDVQAVLRWLALHHAWPCDPGPIDGILGPRSRAALDGFRQVSRDAGSSAGELGSPLGVEDWLGCFDAYDRVLARSLACTREQLAGHRASLVFTDPPVLACGEHHPRTAAGVDRLACADNRRVDLLFFDAAELPDLAAKPPGADVYRGRYVFEPIQPEPYSMFTLRLVGDDGAPIPGARVTVRVDADEQVLVSDAEGAVFVLGHEGAKVEIRSVVSPDAALLLSSITAVTP